MQSRENGGFFCGGKLVGGNQLVQNAAGNSRYLGNAVAVGIKQPDRMTKTGKVGGDTNAH